MKELFDLDIDFYDNIYIVGGESNNIYIFLNFGEFIRMIEDILKLIFCKIDEEEGIIYVICEGKIVYVYWIWFFWECVFLW